MQSKTFVDGNKVRNAATSVCHTVHGASRNVQDSLGRHRSVSQSKRGSTYLSDFMHALVIGIRLLPVAARGTRLASRFLTLSAHRSEMSDLATIAALRIAESAPRFLVSSFTKASTR